MIDYYFVEDAAGRRFVSCLGRDEAAKLAESGTTVKLCGEPGAFTESGRVHRYIHCPPSAWAADQGATDSLLIEAEMFYTTAGHLAGSCTRPAIVGKTVAYIGVDEDDRGKIVWEKWKIRRR